MFVTVCSVAASLDCQGCDCDHPLRTRDDNDQQTCFFVPKHSLEISRSTCEVSKMICDSNKLYLADSYFQDLCHTHGGHLPKIIDEYKRLKFSAYREINFS